MVLFILPAGQLYPVVYLTLKLQSVITMRLFQASYKIFCVGLFLYHAGKCIDQYVNQDPVTMRCEVKQEDHPRPQICLSTEK